MPNYDSHTMGKLIIQDWDVVAGYPDVPLLYILTPQQADMLVGLCPPQKWLTRWENPPAKDTLDAFVAETMFNLMNPITCAMLQECLGELIDAQTEAIINALENLSEYGTETPGLPLTELELTENIAGVTNPECDHDILWAQCLALIQYTNLAITNLFEQIESASNSAELLELLDSVPFLNFITTNLGISGAGAVANYFQEAVTEGYLAQYDSSVEETIACGLFCLFRDDCSVDLDSVINYFNQRVIALVPDEPGDLLELIEIIVGLDFDGTEVVDLMFWFAWQGIKLAQFVISSATNADQFKRLLMLAVDDASGDWEILCTECVDLNVTVYNDFSRTTIKQVIPVQYGVPFDIEVDPSTWGSNEFFAVWGIDLDYDYTVIVGTYTPTVGEAAWAYINTVDAVIDSGPGVPATDLATPSNARGIFMNASEADTSTHTVQITLNP